MIKINKLFIQLYLKVINNFWKIVFLKITKIILANNYLSIESMISEISYFIEGEAIINVIAFSTTAFMSIIGGYISYNYYDYYYNKKIITEFTLSNVKSIHRFSLRLPDTENNIIKMQATWDKVQHWVLKKEKLNWHLNINSVFIFLFISSLVFSIYGIFINYEQFDKAINLSLIKKIISEFIKFKIW